MQALMGVESLASDLLIMRTLRNTDTSIMTNTIYQEQRKLAKFKKCIKRKFYFKYLSFETNISICLVVCSLKYRCFKETARCVISYANGSVR